MHTLITFLRNQLIDALNSTNSKLAPNGPLRVPPFLDSELLLSKLPALRSSDYPQVKHWTRKHGNKAQVAVIKVTDTSNPDDFDDDSSESDGSDLVKDDGVPAFLEGEDGALI